jgi:hypothetical protein
MLFKGLLSSNLAEAQPFCNQIGVPGFTYTTFLQEIHDVRTSEFDTWDKQDWLCLQCVEETIQSHLHLWFLEHKRKGMSTIASLSLANKHTLSAPAGQTIYEDCWYVLPDDYCYIILMTRLGMATTAEHKLTVRIMHRVSMYV